MPGVYYAPASRFPSFNARVTNYVVDFAWDPMTASAWESVQATPSRGIMIKAGV